VKLDSKPRSLNTSLSSRPSRNTGEQWSSSPSHRTCMHDTQGDPHPPHHRILHHSFARRAHMIHHRQRLPRYKPYRPDAPLQHVQVANGLPYGSGTIPPSRHYQQQEAPGSLTTRERQSSPSILGRRPNAPTCSSPTEGSRPYTHASQYTSP
jgi:hypothetical protein